MPENDLQESLKGPIENDLSGTRPASRTARPHRPLAAMPGPRAQSMFWCDLCATKEIYLRSDCLLLLPEPNRVD